MSGMNYLLALWIWINMSVLHISTFSEFTTTTSKTISSRSSAVTSTTISTIPITTTSTLTVAPKSASYNSAATSYTLQPPTKRNTTEINMNGTQPAPTTSPTLAASSIQTETSPTSSTQTGTTTISGTISTTKGTTSYSDTTAQENITYILSSSNSTLDKACFDNGPAVIDGIQFYQMKFPQNLNLSPIIGRVRVWIGYYQKMYYFNLLGCLPVHGEDYYSIIGNTPGRCAMACNHFNYIGLEDNICHCLNFNGTGSTQFRNSATCSMKMCNGTNFICGIRGQMWIYGVNIGNTSYFDELAKKFDNAKKCISVQYKQYERGIAWSFTNCLEPHQSLCELNDTAIEFAALKQSTKEPWNEATSNCFNKSEIPASIEIGNFRHYKIQDFESAWTAYIRDEVIQEKGSEQSSHGRIKCLSLSVTEGQPEFHLEDCQNSLPSMCLAGITTARTMMLMTTTTTNKMSSSSSSSSSSASIRITSIASTTSSPVIASVSSNIPITSTSSTRQSLETKTLTSSQPQSTSIRIDESSISTPKLQAKESTFKNNEFPMFGWIGIGIGVLVVFVVVGVLIIQRCKRKRIVKERTLSSQILSDPSNNTNKLINGVAMSEIDAKEARNIEVENEMHKTSKCPGDDWPEAGDPKNDWDIQPDNNFEGVQIDVSVLNYNGRQANITAMKDKEESTGYLYGIVDKAAKRSPKIIETGQASGTSTYDLTYVHNQEVQHTDGDYYHIYDHANFKNPTNSAQ